MKATPIKNVLTSNVISVSSETLLTEAITIMEKDRISCLVVVDNGKTNGIFTEKDLIMAMHMRAHLDGLKIDELMSRQVITADINIDVLEAVNIISSHNIRHLVINDSDGRLAGVVTLTDIRLNLGLEYFVEIKQISKIMTQNVVTLNKDAFIRNVISKMSEFSISCVVIEEDKRPAGILTERDIVRLFGDEDDIRNIVVKDVMKSPVETVSLDIPVHEAFTLMNQKRIRRLVVVDSAGMISGLITQSDIVGRLERRYVKTLKDIIKKKEAELQETRKLLNEKILLENIMRFSMDIAIIASDLDLNIIYFNPFAEEIFRFSEEDAFGKTVPELLENETAELSFFQQALQTVQKGKDSSYVIEKKKRKGVQFIETSLSGIWNDSEDLVGYVLMLRDITERKKAEKIIENSESRLRRQKTVLEKKNIALREIINQIDIEKNLLKEDITINVHKTLLPLLSKMDLNEDSIAYRKLLEFHLNDIVSSFGRKMTGLTYNLTKRETEICNMIKGGLRNKEISHLLNISPDTVARHRKNIRKKLNISNQKTNLYFFLRNF